MRLFQHAFGWAAVLLVAVIVDSGRAGEQISRPNILWISCEDSSPNLGCYGDRHAITPNLDRLANEGIRFENAFSVAGVCAPSRSCIITGMYPSSIGSQHMRSRATLSPQIRCFSEYLREAGYFCTNNSKTDYNFDPPRSAWDENSRTAHWKHRAADQPFFAVFNLVMTHESQVRADDATHAKNTAKLTDAQRQKPATIELPPYYPDTPVVRREWAHYLELLTAMDVRAGELLDELASAGLADNTVVCFFSDHGVGLPRAKRWLYDSGLHVPLIVRWPGNSPAGSVDSRLVSLIDLAPTMLSIAGVPIPDHFQGRSFLGNHQGSAREYVFGIRDRMDERYDLIRAVRDRRFKYIRNWHPELPYAQYLDYAEAGGTMQEIRRLAVAGKLKPVQRLFLSEIKPVEELYDLAYDPHETKNLAKLPAYRGDLERLRAVENRWIDESLDSGFLPEPELERLAGNTGIYAKLRSDANSALVTRLRKVAELATTAEQVSVPDLFKAAEDREPAIRYWGVMGLSRFTNDESAHKAVMSSIKDSSPCVRIAAANALCAAGDTNDSLAILIDALGDQQASVRLLAANAIDNSMPWRTTGDARAKFRPEFQRLLGDKNEYVGRVMRRMIDEIPQGTP